MKPSRRSLLLMGAGALAGRAAQVRYREYSRCLPDYLRELAVAADAKRSKEIAKLTTSEAIRARQRWVRDTFWKLTGGMPERTPLDQRTAGSFERNGYRVEKIVYQSLPGFHIPASLYIPTTGKPPYPGVLFQMGHSLNGKAAVPYQKCCQGLARLGYLVLAFDPMGQGERTYYPKPGGTLTRLNSADSEHTLPGRQMLLTGVTATQMQAWDAVRSLDVLAAHPMVDPKRLASTGQSGGGTLTMFLMAVDDRLAAAAVSSGNTENFANAEFNPPGSTDDAEQDFINSGPVGFDRWDLLYPMAPKPLLVLASARDFFGTYSPRYISNGRAEFDRLRDVYGVMKAADRIEWDETPTPHMLSYYMRTRIYRWFEKHLKGRSVEEVPEPEVAPEKDETLWVGPSGLTTKDFGSKTPIQLTRERMARLAPVAATTRGRVQELLEIGELPPGKLEVLRRVPSERATIAAVEVASEPNVFAPAWLIAPLKEDRTKPVLIVVEQGGRSVRWSEDGMYHDLAARGVTVCAADIRGMGDMAGELGRGNPRHAVARANEEAWAWASLMLGKPLVGQRAADLVAFARCFERVALAASGTMTVPALFAAALEPRIESVYLFDGLESYRSLVEADEPRHPTANFVFGVLQYFDLNDVAKLTKVVKGAAWDADALHGFWQAL
jgi:cephalosporin-C deacetylase-like acetyl esterase